MPILTNPLPRPQIQVLGEQSQVLVEVKLHARAHAESGKDRGEKKQRVQPVTPLGRVYDNDPDLLPFRVKQVVFLRRRLYFRH
jgi:hypothetical protein